MIDLLRMPAATIALGLSILATSAQAGPYTSVSLFGDSLSDTGNVRSLTVAFIGTAFPDYVDAPGRFSNGPVWIEHLAGALGAASVAQPANLMFTGASVIPIGPPGGTNYAFGGARTGLGGSAGPTTGLMGQLINWNGSTFAGSLTRAADPDALYILIAGADDLRDARTANPGTTPADEAERSAAVAVTVQNIIDAAGLLARAGARHFLLSNLPDLGRTPEAVDLGVVAASTDVTEKFNAMLDGGIATFEALFTGLTGIDLDIRMLDLAQLADDVFTDATTSDGARFGITNVTAPCIEPIGPLFFFVPGSSDADGNCGISAFSDTLHPSAAYHRLIASAAAPAPTPAPVPIPATGSLLAFALAVVARGRFQPRCSR